MCHYGAVTYDNCDKKPDLHCVACDGKTVRDNSRHAKVKRLTRCSTRATARRRTTRAIVFRSLFLGLKVVVKNVYELKRNPGEENEDQAP